MLRRRDGLTRRQRSAINKAAWAEKRRLLEEEWARIREERSSASPIPPFPTSSPLPNARGRTDAGDAPARERDQS